MIVHPVRDIHAQTRRPDLHALPLTFDASPPGEHAYSGVLRAVFLQLIFTRHWGQMMETHVFWRSVNDKVKLALLL